MYFEYGENEILYLKNKNRKLAEVIEKIGLIKRETDTDLFSSVIHHIIGQQISTKAHTGVFNLDAVEHMSDEDAIRELSALKGIGVWTAEMILLFCLQRPNIFTMMTLQSNVGCV